MLAPGLVAPVSHGQRIIRTAPSTRNVPYLFERNPGHHVPGDNVSSYYIENAGLASTSFRISSKL